MTEPIKIGFQKGWMPDFYGFEAPEGSLQACENLIPMDDYFRPFYGKTDVSTDAVHADYGELLKAIEFRSNNLSYYPFIFSAEKIYRMNTNLSLTDFTVITADYATVLNNWSVVQYGEWVIATNYNDAIQVKKDMSGANKFAVLGGSPPKAKYMILANGHLVVAYINDGTVYPNKIQWSALEDPETWTASLTTGADEQNLADSDSEITGMAALNDGFAVFHENSITKCVYIGAPYTFSIKQNYVRNIGAIAHTMISVNGVVYFWGEKDIYKFDGSNCVPIGIGLRDTLLTNYHISYKHRITTFYDSKTGIIYWSYPSTSSTDGTPDKILCYNVNNQRFSRISLSAHAAIFKFRQGAEDADSWGAYTGIDGETGSVPQDPIYYVDSSTWISTSSTLGCLNTSTRKVSTLNGDILTATIETYDVKIGDNIVYVTGVRPVTDLNANITAYIGSKYLESDSISWSDAITLNTNSGNFDTRKSGRFLRLKLELLNHNGIISCEAMAQPRGKR